MITTIYGSPEQFGLRIVAEIDLCQNRDYEFNKIVVWAHDATRRLFYGEFHGCSCPDPFSGDYFKSPNDTSLNEIRASNVLAFERIVHAACTTNLPTWVSGQTLPVRADFIRSVLDQLQAYQREVQA